MALKGNEIRTLLLRQLEQELYAGVQMAFLAGIVEDLSLSKLFLEFAKEELEHFSLVSSILSKKGFEISKEPFKLSIETDELKALIILESIENTIIHYYEELVPLLREPFKSQIRDQIATEKNHKEEMEALLEKVKENIKVFTEPDRRSK